MGIGHLQVVSVPVGDQDRAKQFYADKLGFTVVRDGAFGEDMRWVQLQPPGGGAAITLVTWFPSMPAGSLKGAVLSCDDVERTAQELTARGVELGDGGQVQEAPWGRWVTLDDPDGNSWIVQQDNPGF
jgi:catechol 2,3-dioxygenase-like lactoylglutathione lyase family enzyme